MKRTIVTNYRNLALLSLFAFFLITFSSCDPCRNTECLNGGICDEGNCLCQNGYSGENCEDFDACWNRNCQNGGICLEGTCICANGYEGVDCEWESRAKFLGSFDVGEVCDGSTDSYVCIITPSTVEVTRVIFTNFFNLESLGITQDVYGSVNGEDISIPTQMVSTITFAGSGSINPATSVVSLAFTATEAGTTLNCVATFTLQ